MDGDLLAAVDDLREVDLDAGNDTRGASVAWMFATTVANVGSTWGLTSSR